MGRWSIYFSLTSSCSLHSTSMAQSLAHVVRVSSNLKWQVHHWVPRLTVSQDRAGSQKTVPAGCCSSAMLRQGLAALKSQTKDVPTSRLLTVVSGQENALETKTPRHTCYSLTLCPAHVPTPLHKSQTPAKDGAKIPASKVIVRTTHDNGDTAHNTD